MNRRSTCLAALTATATLGLAALPANAQTGGIFDLTWSTIDGGGGTSTGSNGTTTFSLSGTIGQPDAGQPMTGSNGTTTFSLTGGFWPGITTVTRCNPADIADNGANAGFDGCVDNGDFQLFINLFFSTSGSCAGAPIPCNAGDIADNGANDTPDGFVDNGDFQLFITSFFNSGGCTATCIP
jgi:hypothetical protein